MAGGAALNELIAGSRISRDFDLFTGDLEAARLALARGEILFHPGRIRGAFPRIIPSGTA